MKSQSIECICPLSNVDRCVTRRRTGSISTANAQRTNDPSAPHSGYDLSWYTIDGGGTIGQPDAGALSGGSYQLNGGFWGGASISYNIYLPLTMKNF